MKLYDVIVLTEDRYESPNDLNLYNLQVLLEDEYVVSALKDKGLKVERKSWSDPSVNWADTTCILFRSTWDYFDRFPEFSEWLDRVSDETILLNSKEIIYWNLDKHYLSDLENKGVNCVETYYLEKGRSVRLEDFLADLDIKNAIIKPCVSGAARHTYKLNSVTCADYNETINDLLQEEAFMVQPFQENIIKTGELSLIVMGGKYTHAVRKVAKQGDFRVQDDHGGVVLGYTPTEEEIQFAEKAVAACNERPLYARVDMIRDNANKLAIMELELIEPELFFRFYKPAADRLADVIAQRVQSVKSLTV